MDWQGWQVCVVTNLDVVSCTSSIPVNLLNKLSSTTISTAVKIFNDSNNDKMLVVLKGCWRFGVIEQKAQLGRNKYWKKHMKEEWISKFYAYTVPEHFLLQFCGLIIWCGISAKDGLSKKHQMFFLQFWMSHTNVLYLSVLKSTCLICLSSE